jgi:hypothetical protein
MDRQVIAAISLIGAIICFYFYFKRRRARKMRQLR